MKEDIQRIKTNPRWKVIQTKVEGRDATEFNSEEIMLLTTVAQLEAQELSRIQGDRMAVLTNEMKTAAEESAKQARRLARWTMLLAIATFALALVSVLKQ